MTINNSHPSLYATITTGIVGGALVGYLAGSGIEDILNQFSIARPIEMDMYLKPILFGIGALGWSALGTLQYFNRDEHKGILVMHVVEKKAEKPKIEYEPNLKGVANVVEELTSGIHNQVVAQDIYSKITRALSHNPIDNARTKYEMHRDGYFANSFEVFRPFRYKERIINPKDTLDNFFEKGNVLYKMGIEGISNLAGKIATNQEHSNKGWQTEFRNVLEQEAVLAQDIALWVTYLSKRSGIVGSNVRAKLKWIGFTNPDYLEHDVRVFGNNIIKLYGRLTQIEFKPQSHPVPDAKGAEGRKTEKDKIIMDSIIAKIISERKPENRTEH